MTTEKPHLLLKRDDAIATISTNDAPWNRMSLEFIDELEKVIDELALDKSVRAIIITGEGDEHFSVGMNLKQIGNYEAFIEYMNAVFKRTEDWLAGLDPGELERVVIPRPFPPQIESTFSARVAGEAGITALDGIECWIYQHGLRHMGEIELSRSFVGLQGMTS